MKRPNCKDDLFTRPTSNFSPAEQEMRSGQDQMSTPNSRHRLTKDDAMAYLKVVNDIFQDNKEICDQFLEILKAFQAQRFEGHGNENSDFVDIMPFFSKGDMPGAEAQREVSVLLQGHTDLLEEFMHFLPDAMVAEYVHYNQLGRDYILRHDGGVSPMINARSMSAERNIHHPDTDKWNCIEKENKKQEYCDRNDWE